VSGLKVWHGEAVAIGMVAEARIAQKMGLLDRDDVWRLTSLLERAGLPTGLPSLDQAALLAAMRHDKKISRGKLSFALPTSIGKVAVTDRVETAVIEQVLTNYDAKP
jgi:3-dehydroquinate synthase